MSTCWFVNFWKSRLNEYRIYKIQCKYFRVHSAENRWNNFGQKQPKLSICIDLWWNSTSYPKMFLLWRLILTSSDPFWTSRISWISWISSVSIHLEKNILESVKQLCNWKNEVCSIFDFKQLTVPKNWISSQSNPFWLYGFCKEHSQIMSLLRISVWPWSFSLFVSICGHPWLLCGRS